MTYRISQCHVCFLSGLKMLTLSDRMAELNLSPQHCPRPLRAFGCPNLPPGQFWPRSDEMRLFPTLFYIACIILLGIRLRPLHHSASNSLSSVFSWCQRVTLGPRVGWIYRLVNTSLTWLRKHPSSDSLLPLTTSPAGSGNNTYFTNMWRVDVLIRGLVARVLESVGRFWRTMLTVVVDEVGSFGNVRFHERVKEFMGSECFPVIFIHLLCYLQDMSDLMIF